MLSKHEADIFVGPQFDGVVKEALVVRKSFYVPALAAGQVAQPIPVTTGIASIHGRAEGRKERKCTCSCYSQCTPQRLARRTRRRHETLPSRGAACSGAPGARVKSTSTLRHRRASSARGCQARRRRSSGTRTATWGRSQLVRWRCLRVRAPVYAGFLRASTEANNDDVV